MPRAVFFLAKPRFVGGLLPRMKATRFAWRQRCGIEGMGALGGGGRARQAGGQRTLQLLSDGPPIAESDGHRQYLFAGERPAKNSKIPLACNYSRAFMSLKESVRPSGVFTQPEIS